MKNDRRVGEPLLETLLTDMAYDAARTLLPPRGGQRLLVIREAEPGVGRPDLLLVTSWTSQLRTAKNRPRLHNLTEARVLAALLSGGNTIEAPDVGLSRDHFRRLQKNLTERGWVGPQAVRAAQGLVVDSLLIEAKLSHWSVGLQQLARLRWLTHHAALLVPVGAERLVDRRALKRYGLGLFVADADSLRAVRSSTRRKLSLPGRLWLSELAIRAFEGS